MTAGQRLIEQGRQQGIEQGIRGVLLRLLRQRFGDAVIPASISDSARACSAAENLRLRAGTRSRLRPREVDFETPLPLRDE